MPAIATTDRQPLPLRLVLVHAQADRHHAFAFQQALAHALAIQPQPPELRVVALNRQGDRLGIGRSMRELLLSRADAVVFLLSPRYFIEHLDWPEQLQLARRTHRGMHVIVAEPLHLRRTGFEQYIDALPSNALPCDVQGSWPRMLRLASELSNQLFPPQPVRDVLCMFASPEGLDHLALHREWRAIDDVNRQVGAPLELESRWAARIHDVEDALLDAHHDVLHFSGHGEPGRLFFETPDGRPHAVSTERLVHMLAKHQPRCLIFNACHSADTLASARSWVPDVIAMQGPTTDESAIEFSRALYAALARGRSVRQAFEHAFDSLSLASVHEECRPRLL